MVAFNETTDSRCRILALIPARGGSKGVPRKNIREVAGQPLIAYSIQAALEAGELFDSIVVSTDDPEIADVARAFGAEVPFLRPPNLACDKAPTVPVIQHAVSFIEAKSSQQLDWVCLLQPTCPLRTGDDIREAVRLAQSRPECDSVISVHRVLANHPALMKRIEKDRLVPFSIPEVEGTRRQDYAPHAYMRNGAIYLTRRDVVMNQASVWGQHIAPFVMPDERSTNVDSELDLRMAELLLNERQAKYEKS